jgi:hypothetical protein
MKTSSATDGVAPPDRQAAWACTLANLLALPGLGSLSVGRRVGWVQAALALVGFALTIGGLLRTLLDWVTNAEEWGANLLAPDLSYTIFMIKPTAALFVGLAGLAISFGAWFWGLATSLQVLREARRHERESAAPPSTPPVLRD